MGWSGGTFSRVHDWTTDEGAGIDIQSSRMDAEDDNFAAGINACLVKDGTNSPTADLPMGSHKHTGCSDPSGLTQYATVNSLYGAMRFGTLAGGPTTYTLSLGIDPSALVVGMMFMAKCNVSCAINPTINVNSLGAKSVIVGTLQAKPLDMLAGRCYIFIYDGTYFNIIGGRDFYHQRDVNFLDIVTTTSTTYISTNLAKMSVPNYWVGRNVGVHVAVNNPDKLQMQLKFLSIASSVLSTSTDVIAGYSSGFAYSDPITIPASTFFMSFEYKSTDGTNVTLAVISVDFF